MSAHKPTAAAIIAAVRARGNDARDLRDAAHEAYHALDSGVRGEWERERIHRALCRKYRRRADLLRAEVEARAVEQIVCADLGVDPGGGVDKWALISGFEAIKFGLPHMSPDLFAGAVRRWMGTPEARAAADRVLALAQGAT